MARVRRSPMPELKYHDTANYYASVNTAGQVIAISSIAQGTDVTDRIGNKITIKNIHVRGTFTNVTGAPAQVRIIFFIDKYGQTGAGTDILFWANTAYACLGPVTADSTPRFKILRDKVYDIDTESRPTHTVNEFLKMNHTVNYYGALGTEVYSGVVYMLVLSSKTTDLPSFRYVSRMRFMD